MSQELLVTAAAQATPKKSNTSTKSNKKPKSKPTHPPTAEMVTAAISTLKERNGSSFQAIRKYIVGEYMLDAERQTPFLKRYIKSAVEKGEIIQTKGRGASGSFKLPSKSSKSKTVTEKKVAVEKKPEKKTAASKKVDAKKTAGGKKSPVKKTKETKKKNPAKISLKVQVTKKTSTAKTATKQ